MKTDKITLEEIKVIKAAQMGNIRAFNRIYKKYKAFVSNILYNYIRDKDEANDIANIVFLKVYDNIEKFTDYTSFGGWLRIITNNTAIDYLRKIKHSPVVSDTLDSRLVSNMSAGSNETDLVNRLTHEQLLEEFNALSEQAQKVCRLFYLENMTSKDIGETLGMPENTVKSHLRRSRQRLQNKFKQQPL